jgi:hypothetical protein
VDFARQYYYKRNKTRKYCVLCRKLGFKIELKRSGAHPDNINIDKGDRWRGTKNYGRYIQCSVALCIEDKYFKYYCPLKKLI